MRHYAHLPRWSEDALRESREAPLPAVQEDAERALLQAIAAHARESMSADGEAALPVACVVSLSQSLVMVRSARREG